MAELDMKDCLVDVYPSVTRQGMYTNTTSRGFQVKHLPSGLTVSCDQHRSQHKNRHECLKAITAYLKECE